MVLGVEAAADGPGLIVTGNGVAAVRWAAMVDIAAVRFPA